MCNAHGVTWLCTCSDSELHTRTHSGWNPHISRFRPLKMTGELANLDLCACVRSGKPARAASNEARQKEGTCRLMSCWRIPSMDHQYIAEYGMSRARVAPRP